MRIRQLTIRVELLEYDVSKCPEPALPRQVYACERMFMGEDADSALEAAKFLASRMGLEEIKNKYL